MESVQTSLSPLKSRRSVQKPAVKTGSCFGGTRSQVNEQRQKMFGGVRMAAPGVRGLLKNPPNTQLCFGNLPWNDAIVTRKAVPRCSANHRDQPKSQLGSAIRATPIGKEAEGQANRLVSAFLMTPGSVINLSSWCCETLIISDYIGFGGAWHDQAPAGRYVGSKNQPHPQSPVGAACPNRNSAVCFSQTYRPDGAQRTVLPISTDMPPRWGLFAPSGMSGLLYFIAPPNPL
jgi:hypothetical protein